jgi:uncharacterized protein (DUF4415 family)
MSARRTGTVKFHLNAQRLPTLTAAQKKALLAKKDEQVDHSEIPSQVDVSWTWPGALVPSENKRQLTIRLDSDVVAFFQSTGKRYQSRINAALREYMNAHKRAG